MMSADTTGPLLCTWVRVPLLIIGSSTLHCWREGPAPSRTLPAECEWERGHLPPPRAPPPTPPSAAARFRGTTNRGNLVGAVNLRSVREGAHPPLALSP